MAGVLAPLELLSAPLKAGVVDASLWLLQHPALGSWLPSDSLAIAAGTSGSHFARPRLVIVVSGSVELVRAFEGISPFSLFSGLRFSHYRKGALSRGHIDLHYVVVESSGQTQNHLSLEHEFALLLSRFDRAELDLCLSRCNQQPSASDLIYSYNNIPVRACHHNPQP